MLCCPVTLTGHLNGPAHVALRFFFKTLLETRSPAAEK